ncbi:ImmA/IrrE family metallo-endopeptidase [Rubritalea spongiae]|uniref:ImmA/IrrE family metallo-endopeptidase n=1 Tax=Rubritalea spongiae TaxID=430797 RepID=A0ABW5E232_9BACT
MNKLIKTESDYEEAMEKLHALMLANPDEGTAEADELDLLAHLIEVYESQTVDIPPPTPIEAIKFRMDQQGLKQKDLIPYIGNKARVSEILSGKRELTMAMARTLSRELDISAQTLLGIDSIPEAIDTSKYPLNQMLKLRYFGDITIKDLKAKAEDYLHHFFQGAHQTPALAFNRTGFKVDAKLDEYALHAWRCNLIKESEKVEVPIYRVEDLTDEFLSSLAMLTQFDSGKDLIIQALRDKGVIVLTNMTHFPKTYLDGAAMMNSKGNPVIGMTFRHNRLDNFWHTLFHELGHVIRHLPSNPNEAYFDDTESHDNAKVEREADDFALNTLIPEDTWKNEIRHLEKAGEIRAAAKRLGICPSIIAGRLRKANNNYRLHRTLIGSGTLR